MSKISQTKLRVKSLLFSLLLLFSPSANGLINEDNKTGDLLNERLNSLQEKLDKISERMKLKEQKFDLLQTKVLRKHLESDSNYQKENFLQSPESKDLTAKFKNETAADSTSKDSIPEQKQTVKHSKESLKNKLKNKKLNYYFSFSTNRNFSSNCDIKTSSGNVDLNNKAGFGLSVEFGRSFSIFDLGLAAGFDHMSFGDLKSGGTTINGNGNSSTYYFVAKPGLDFDIGDRFSFKSSIDIGLARRQSEYNAISIAFKQSGESISMIWGLQFAGYFKLKDNNQLFAGYRMYGNPSADEFENYISHSVEAGFKLNF